MRRLQGFPLVVGATAIAGVAGYLITWWVARQTGLVAYRLFAEFWACFYLIIGSLSGIQQEITRATRPLAFRTLSATHNHHARNFAIASSVLVTGLIAATAPFWQRAVFPSGGWALVLPLAVGIGSYVFVAVISGSLYGTSQWVPLAWMIVIDPVLRLIVLVIALFFTRDLFVLAWLVAVPVPATLLILSPLLRRRLALVPETDVAFRPLVWNVARTVLAAAGLSLMVSGFPLALGVTTHGNSAQVGLLILLITLTRAPLIVTVMSLQSFLIVRFRDHASTMWRTFFVLVGVLIGAAAVLAALAWLIGPPLFALLFPRDPHVDGWLLAVLVGSSALVAAMCISGAATLSRSDHFVYSLGWVVAAVVTVAALVLPFPLVQRAVASLVAGPAAGLLVHAVGLILSRRRVLATTRAASSPAEQMPQQ